MSEDLTRESFERAMKIIEEDAEWELRNPRIEVYHPKDLEMLRKAGFFKETKWSNLEMLLEE
jgi:hypothetical protein